MSSDNYVEVNEIKKSPLHRYSLSHLGQVTNPDDYDEYLLGGMKSFSKDPFFKTMFVSGTQCRNMEKKVRTGGCSFASQGSKTGVIHMVNWDKELKCFLVWKHIPKDHPMNSMMKLGGRNFHLNMGSGIESIVNHPPLTF